MLEKENFWDIVQALRISGSLCDVQLCVMHADGSHLLIPAHKLVLVSCSHYFQSCFDEQQLLDCYNFDGITAENLQIVLDYMYRQRTWADLTRNPEALAAADVLGVIRHEELESHSHGKVLYVKKVVPRNIRSNKRSIQLSNKDEYSQKQNNSRILLNEKELESHLHTAEEIAQKYSARVKRAKPSNNISVTPSEARDKNVQQKTYVNEIDNIVTINLSEQVNSTVTENVSYGDEPSVECTSVASSQPINVNLQGKNIDVSATSIDTMSFPVIQQIHNEDLNFSTEHSLFSIDQASRSENKVLEEPNVAEGVIVIESEQVSSEKKLGDKYGTISNLADMETVTMDCLLIQEDKKNEKSSELNVKTENIFSSCTESNSDKKDVASIIDKNTLQDHFDEEVDIKRLVTKDQTFLEKNNQIETSQACANTDVQSNKLKAIKKLEISSSKEEVKLHTLDTKLKSNSLTTSNLPERNSIKNHNDDAPRRSGRQRGNCRYRGSEWETATYKKHNPKSVVGDGTEENISNIIKTESVGEASTEKYVKKFPITPSQDDTEQKQISEHGLEKELLEINSSSHELEELEEQPCSIKAPSKSQQNKEKNSHYKKISSSGSHGEKTSSKHLLMNEDSGEQISMVKSEIIDNTDGYETKNYSDLEESCESELEENFKISVKTYVSDCDQNTSKDDVKPVKRKRGRPPKPKPIRQKGCLACSECGKLFKNITGLSNHMHWKHNASPTLREGGQHYNCSHCGMEVKSFPALITHERKIHSIHRLYQCDRCDLSFDIRRKLKHHMITAHDEGLLVCEECGTRFQTKEGWKIHMKKQHSGDQPCHMCELCGKVFVRKAELAHHMKFTHSDERLHQCMLCPRAFKNASSLRRHLRTYHSNQRDHKCNVCGSLFKSVTDMKVHRTKHFREKNPIGPEGKVARKRDGQYPCKFCGKIFKSTVLCKSHEKLQHVEKQEGVSYNCTVCDKKFALQHYLLAHIQQRHAPRRFHCLVCSHGFTHRYELKRHQERGRCSAIPEAAKPYSCPRCSMRFTLKGNLQKHMSMPGRCRRAIDSDRGGYVMIVEEDQCDESKTISLTEVDPAGNDVKDPQVIYNSDQNIVLRDASDTANDALFGQSVIKKDGEEFVVVSDDHGKSIIADGRRMIVTEQTLPDLSNVVIITPEDEAVQSVHNISSELENEFVVVMQTESTGDIATDTSNLVFSDQSGQLVVSDGSQELITSTPVIMGDEQQQLLVEGDHTAVTSVTSRFMTVENEGEVTHVQVPEGMMVNEGEVRVNEKGELVLQVVRESAQQQRHDQSDMVHMQITNDSDIVL